MSSCHEFWEAFRDLLAEFACAQYILVLSISFTHNLLNITQFKWIFATLKTLRSFSITKTWPDFYAFLQTIVAVSDITGTPLASVLFSKAPLLLLRSCNLLITLLSFTSTTTIVVMRRAKTRERARNLNLWALWIAMIRNNRSYTFSHEKLSCVKTYAKNSKNFCLSSTRHLSSTLLTRNHLGSVKAS